jgi:hypothetical protein
MYKHAQMHVLVKQQMTWHVKKNARPVLESLLQQVKISSTAKLIWRDIFFTFR